MLPIQISWVDDLIAYFTGTKRGSLARLPIAHLVYPQKFFVTSVFNFSWDDCNTHQK